MHIYDGDFLEQVLAPKKSIVSGLVYDRKSSFFNWAADSDGGFLYFSGCIIAYTGWYPFNGNLYKNINWGSWSGWVQIH